MRAVLGRSILSIVFVSRRFSLEGRAKSDISLSPFDLVLEPDPQLSCYQEYRLYLLGAAYRHPTVAGLIAPNDGSGCVMDGRTDRLAAVWRNLVISGRRG